MKTPWMITTTRERLAFLVGIAALGLLGNAQTLTDLQKIEQASALIKSITSLTDTGKTNQRNILTRLETLKGQLVAQPDPVPPPSAPDTVTHVELQAALTEAASVRDRLMVDLRTALELQVTTLAARVTQLEGAAPSPTPAPTPTPTPTPDPTSGAHQYFDDVIRRTDLHTAYSLRPRAGQDSATDPYFAFQLDDKAKGGFRNGSSLGTPESKFIVYDPAADAAKISIPAFGTRATLAEAVTAAATTIAVPSSAGMSYLQSGRALRIDDEILVCTGAPVVSGDRITVSVSRAQFGTVAAAHAAGVAVKVTVSGLDPAAQLRFPINSTPGNTYVFTWDVKYSSAWLGVGDSGNTGTKSFQISRGSDTFLVEVKNGWRGSPGSNIPICAGYDPSKHIGAFFVRIYNNAYAGAASWADSGGGRVGPNVTNPEFLSPMRGTFCITADRWNRVWVQVSHVANDYDLVSLWIADEQREPVLVIDKLQISITPDASVGERLHKFWFEFNDTYTRHCCGSVNPFRDRDVWLRNWAVLKNPSNLPTLLVRPQ